MASDQHIDLHCHSVFSDGTFTPETLVEQAANAGLAAFSITDHDTVMGVQRAQAVADRMGLNFIPGVEISAACLGICVHILGYHVDPGHAGLEAALAAVASSRVHRMDRMVARLRELGVAISIEDVLQEGAEGTWGRPHVARALVRKRLVATFDEAFRRYLGNDRPAYVRRDEVTARQAIHLIHEAGGVAVLAHPYAYRFKERTRKRTLGRLLDELVEARIDGIEVAYSNCSEVDSAQLMAEARRRGLAFSGGSDYHGTLTPHVRIGFGRGNLKIPLGWLHDLEGRRRAFTPAAV